MKAHTASLINALVLIAFGLWAYFGSETPSKTAFIPVGFGIVIFTLYKGIKKEDKIVAHVAVLLTLVILVALIKPLTAALGRNDSMAIVRVVVMMISTAVSMAAFIKSFVDVRRARAAAARDV